MSGTILITGTTSGFGQAMARLFVQNEWKVIGTGRRADRLEKLKTDLGEAFHALVFDIMDEAATTAALAGLPEDFQEIDILVNNAGLTRDNLAMRMKDEEWQQVIDVNLSGHFYMCQAALSSLLEVKGNIVNAASSICFRATPYAAAYAASKGGILAMTRMLSVEYGKRGLRANCVAPGSIKTPMAAPAGIPEDADYDIIMRSMALTGASGPEVIAAAIAYLASDDAHHVTGEHILVDGATCA